MKTKLWIESKTKLFHGLIKTNNIECKLTGIETIKFTMTRILYKHMTFSVIHIQLDYVNVQTSLYDTVFILFGHETF